MAKQKKTKDSFNFNKSIEQLESLVKTLEKGDLPLEETIEEFEKGIVLYKSCRDSLKKMEKKVEVLSKALEEDTCED